jgi:hypothetical protein
MAQNMKKDNNIVHVDRLIMLLIANAFNIGMLVSSTNLSNKKQNLIKYLKNIRAIYAILTSAPFSSQLLHVLLGNFMLYFIMYITNKVSNGELKQAF